LGGKSPRDGVFGKLVELDGGQKHPKLKELVEVVNGEALLKVNLRYIRVVMQGFGDYPIFAFGDVKN
jgi:hypothetical protein